MAIYKVGQAPWEIEKQTFPVGSAPWEIKKEEPSQPGYFERVGSEYSRIGGRVTSGVQEGADALQKGNPLPLLRTGLRTVGGVAEAAFTPILEAPGIKQATEAIAKKVVELPGMKELVARGAELAQQYPNASKDLYDIVNIATLGVGGTVERPLIKEAGAIGSDLAQGTQVLLMPSEQSIQKNVIALFNRSIKPTAKKTKPQEEMYNKNILNALRTIKANTDDLNIEDVTGELVSRTPETIQELSQALDQTKKLVFTQYDGLAKQANGAGVTIDAKPIADEVALVANNKALQLANPGVIQYAKGWSDRLKAMDVLDTETTQEVIKIMNANLQAFYRNPTYDAASKVTIDAGIANNFRKALDTAIEGATGEQYQILKNRYSALKAIENDVIRASMREGRKNTKGLLDYTDIFTGGQMLGGILSLNPAMFTKGAIERGFKEYFKHLNDPNRAIKAIFDKLD